MIQHMLAEELPLGLGIALAKNANAMRYFANLPETKQKAIIAHTAAIESKEEMVQYVDSLMQ